MAISEDTTTLPKITRRRSTRPTVRAGAALAVRPVSTPSPLPAPLDPADLPDQYAMIVEGDCLAPEIEDGAKLVFDKNEPYAAGDLVCLFLRPEVAKPGHHPRLVKRLVMAPPQWVKFPYRDHPQSNVKAMLIAEQMNPKRQYWIPCADLLAIHKCLGPMPVAAKAVRQ